MERRTINLNGYDIVAMAACDYGHVLVLNNNDNCFIVVESTTEGSVFGGETFKMHVHPDATVRHAYFYGVGREFEYANDAYLAALAAMSRITLENCSDAEDYVEGEFVIVEVKS